MSTRLSVLDDHFLVWDRLEPLCILCELRVEGSFEPDRLLHAVFSAVARHPLARARVVSRLRGDYWAIPDRISDLPFDVVDCSDEASVDNARSRLLGRSLDLGTGPPFGLTLMKRSGGDSLCMSLSHVAGDGISAARLMRSIAYAYAGHEDPQPAPDPLTVRDLSFYKKRSLVAEYASEIVRIARRRRRRHADPGTVLSTTDRPSRRNVALHRFEMLRLDRVETALVMARRHDQASVTDLLIASLALTVRSWNEARGSKTQRINLQTAVNLRPREWSTELVSNFAVEASISLSEADQANWESAQLAVARQTHPIRSERAASTIPLIGPINVIPRPLRAAVASRLHGRASGGYTTGLSNLGVIESFASLDNSVGRVTEHWFAPPVTSALGILAGALTFEKEMFLAIHYLDDDLAPDDAHTFAELWRRVLVDA
jgi:NRPS condensation-like uncharacterized protein